MTHLRSSIRFLLLAVTLLAPVARPAQAWVVREDHHLAAVATDRRGNAIVHGPGLYLARYSAAGARKWATRVPNGQETGVVALDRDGNVFLAGAVGATADSERLFVFKIDGATGETLWRARLIPDSQQGDSRYAYPFAIALDTAGHVVVAGATDNGERIFPILAKLNAKNGKIAWATEQQADVREVQVDNHGDILLTSLSAVAAKLDGATGAEVWRTPTLDPQHDGLGPLTATGMTFTDDGDLVVAGSQRNSRADYRVFYAARVGAADGAIRWEYRGPNAPSLDFAYGVALCGRDVITGGRLNGTPAVLRLNGTDGTVQWGAQPWTQDTRTDDLTTVRQVTTDGRCVYACGSEALQRFKISAYTVSGMLKWQEDLGSGQARAMATGQKGKLFVVGTLQNGEEQQPVLIGLNGPTGTPLVRRR